METFREFLLAEVKDKTTPIVDQEQEINTPMIESDSRLKNNTNQMVIASILWDGI